MMMMMMMMMMQGKITAQGKLLLQDTLQVMEQTSSVTGARTGVKLDKLAIKERRVFLFEQIIIFSEEADKRRNNLSSPGYIYKHSIKVSLTHSLCNLSYRSDMSSSGSPPFLIVSHCISYSLVNKYMCVCVSSRIHLFLAVQAQSMPPVVQCLF